AEIPSFDAFIASALFLYGPPLFSPIPRSPLFTMSPNRTIFLLAVSLIATVISDSLKTWRLEKCEKQYTPMLKGEEVKMKGNEFTCKSKEYKVRFKETSSGNAIEADSFQCKEDLEHDAFYLYAVTNDKTYLLKKSASVITCFDASWKTIHTIVACVLGGLILLCCCGGCIIFCIRQKKAAAAVAVAGTPAGPPGAYPQQPSSGPPPPSGSPSA
ncbi:hypothetical protein PRIPAC_72227, partial [Pristionchus pacificus]|uniref:Uncharacterized protein n=1 Tax=Pristionchus pacificus TaxID=54126 RepID=A0A2A6CF88_PRIPA